MKTSLLSAVLQAARCIMPQCLLAVVVLIINGLAVSEAAAQTPAWAGIATINSGNNGSTVTATATDMVGNVYVAGKVTGTATFGSNTLSGDLSYLAKWQVSTGTFAWGIPLLTPGSGYVKLAVSGNAIYATGDNTLLKIIDNGTSAQLAWTEPTTGPQVIAVRGTTVWLSGGVGTPRTSSYLRKCSDTGTGLLIEWGRNFSAASLSSLALVGNTLYAAGSFSDTLQLGTTTLRSAGQSDAFVAKLTDAPTGPVWTWAQRAGGITLDGAGCLVATDSVVYIGGNLGVNSTSATGTSSADFGPITVSPPRASDGFIAKLVDRGLNSRFVWVQRTEGAGNEFVEDLALRGQRLYVTGKFDGVTAQLGTKLLTNAYAFTSSDIFVARLTDAGRSSAVNWAQSVGGDSQEETPCLAVMGTQVVMAGSLHRPARFGTQTIAQTATSFPQVLYPTGFLAWLDDANALGIMPRSTGDGLNVFPNPAGQSATVTLSSSLPIYSAAFTLLDALGQVVRTYSVMNSPANFQYVLDLTGLAPGLYQVRVQGSGMQASQRLVIE